MTDFFLILQGGETVAVTNTYKQARRLSEAEPGTKVARVSLGGMQARVIDSLFN